jgi:hypothetical protein
MCPVELFKRYINVLFSCIPPGDSLSRAFIFNPVAGGGDVGGPLYYAGPMLWKRFNKFVLQPFAGVPGVTMHSFKCTGFVFATQLIGGLHAHAENFLSGHAMPK